MKRKPLWLVATLLTGAVVTCGGFQAEPPARPADVAGVITETQDGRSRILVEERPGVWDGPEGAGAKAYVSVTEGTTILVESPAEELREGSRSDLEIGASARVWYDGPVMESYPEQGTAEAIVVAEPGPG